MCKFFSFCGDGYGNYKYSPWKLRQELPGKDDSPDSHTYILRDVPVELQDRWSRYEYNPLTGKFTVDQGVEGHNHEAAEKWVRARDWSTIVPSLILKPIVHPFKLGKKKPAKQDLQDLKAWNSVRASVWNSVGASVRDSVRDSVGDSVRDSVGDSVWDSVWNSVWDSVWNSVRDSVRDSVWNSVGASMWDSVWAYISSFFDIKYEQDYSPLVRLWERGFVPCYDGKTWRLHSGSKASVVWEGRYEKSGDYSDYQESGSN
jgi:hypothetical protein